MNDENPTELDKRRSAYVAQAIKAVLEHSVADAKYLVDNLFMEWGAEAYKAGRKDLVAEMAKRA
jgi:hypothetical protein